MLWPENQFAYRLSVADGFAAENVAGKFTHPAIPATCAGYEQFSQNLALQRPLGSHAGDAQPIRVGLAAEELAAIFNRGNTRGSQA